MRKLTKEKSNLKRKFTCSAFAVIFTLNMGFSNISAIEFNSSTNEDKETYKEYNATLNDLQINTVMALSSDEELFDDVLFDDYTTEEEPLTLVGTVNISKNLDDGSIKYLEEWPEVTLVDEDDNPVATTDIFCASVFDKSQGDLYYITLYDLNVQEGKTYRLLTTIKDEDKTISKYITYSGDMFISEGPSTNMIYESNDNILEISFSSTNLNKEDVSLLGDLDNNGVVNANDAAMILDMYKYGDDTQEDLKVADLDGNGVINANDAALTLDLYKYSK
jgi:hypothetical protein